MMWNTEKLGCVCDVIAGQSPKGENYNSNGIGLPFYQGKKDYGERYLQEPTVWTKKATKIAYKDDILMSVRAPVGALNIATQEICIGRGLAAIRVKENANKDFIFYALRNAENSIIGSDGAIFNSINKEQIEKIEIPFPPLAEQKKIVKKLDKAFTEANKLADIYKKQIEESNNLKAAFLRQELQSEVA